MLTWGNPLLQNGLSDMMEQFYEGQENRLRILAALHSKDLPVDVSFHRSKLMVIVLFPSHSAFPQSINPQCMNLCVAD